MTDDLLVATQGGDQRDVRAVVGTPRATPSRYRRPITARLRGAGVPLLLAALGVWKPRSLGTPGRLDMALRLFVSRCRGGRRGATLGHHNRTTRPGARCQENYLANKATVSTILRCAQPCRTDPKPDRVGHPTPDRAHLGSEIVAAVRRHETSRVAPAQGELQAPDRRASADEERSVVSFAARAPMSTSIRVLRRGFGSCRRNMPTTFV